MHKELKDSMSYIVCGDKSENLLCNVIHWFDSNGFKFSKGYTERNSSFTQLQKDIKQFSIHWSGTYTAKHTFDGLKYRGLSCNFIIDDDNIGGYATLYQCLDIKDVGWSQGAGMNVLGSGVEISYQPDAWESPNRYSEQNIIKYKVQKHDTVIGKVHNTNLKVFLPTEAQMATLKQLIAAYLRLFPNIPGKFPRDNNGNILYTNLVKPLDYTGLVSHFHLKREKIDVAGLDMQKLEDDLLFINRK